MLEGIELYGEDWGKVAEHVGTRTREKCILQFLQLPIEDPYLEAQLSELGALRHHPLPFSQTDNPVMSTLAFLASVVNPAVAAAAAKAALSEFAQTVEKATTASEAEGKDPNKMEVDQEKQQQQQAAPAVAALSSKETMEKATAAALAAAATKAFVLAQAEERKMQKLVTEAVETQLKKLEIKLTHFEELEIMLANERRQIEKQRAQLFQERVALRKAIQTGESNISNMQIIPGMPQPNPQSQQQPSSSSSQQQQQPDPSLMPVVDGAINRL